MTEKEGADAAANAATAAAAEAKAKEEDAKRTTEQVYYTVLHQFMSLMLQYLFFGLSAWLSYCLLYLRV
jgi:hypothetical protein